MGYPGNVHPSSPQLLFRQVSWIWGRDTLPGHAPREESGPSTQDTSWRPSENHHNSANGPRSTCTSSVTESSLAPPSLITAPRETSQGLLGLSDNCKSGKGGNVDKMEEQTRSSSAVLGQVLVLPQGYTEQCISALFQN